MTKPIGCIDTLPNGTKRLRISVGGKQKTVGYYANERDAERDRVAAADVVREVRSENAGMLVGDYGKTFLTRREVLKIVRDPGNDWSKWDVHIKRDAIAKMGLRALTSAHVFRWLRRLEDRGVSPAMRRGCLNLLRTVLRDALEHGKVRANVALGIKVTGKSKDAWTYLRPEEQVALIDAFEDLDHRLLVAFAIGTGLRAGELVTLRLVDVVLEGDDPHILVRYGKAPAEPTKTGRVRKVPLFGLALDAARRWVPMLGKKNPHGLLFPRERGGFRSEEHVLPWYTWKGMPAKGNRKATVGAVTLAGIDRNVRWHDLRHTCASSLVSGWWGRRWSLEEVKEFLGHTSITQTQRYAHLAQSAVDQAARETRALVTTSQRGGAPGPTRTGDLPLRKRLLYPTELRGRGEKQGLRKTTLPAFLGQKQAVDLQLTRAAFVAAVEAKDGEGAWREARRLALLVMSTEGVQLAEAVLRGGPHAIARAIDLVTLLDHEGLGDDATDDADEVIAR